MPPGWPFRLPNVTGGGGAREGHIKMPYCHVPLRVPRKCMVQRDNFVSRGGWRDSELWFPRKEVEESQIW